MIKYHHIQLRKTITEEDCRLQVQWRNSELSRRSFYSEKPISLEGHLEWVEKIQSNPQMHFFMIDALTDPFCRVTLERPLPIGNAGLLVDPRSNNAEYGGFLIGDASYHGHGFAYRAEYSLMTYGFNHLKLNRIWGEVLAYNNPIRKLHQKIGFKEEGTLRQHILKRGIYEDVIIVGLLQEDLISDGEVLIDND